MDGEQEKKQPERKTVGSRAYLLQYDTSTLEEMNKEKGTFLICSEVLLDSRFFGFWQRKMYSRVVNDFAVDGLVTSGLQTVLAKLLGKRSELSYQLLCLK